MSASMLTDTFKVFRTTDLPDGSRAWVIVAVHAHDKNNFIREVHIARKSDLGGLIYSTDFATVGGADDDTEQRELAEGESWAYNHIANQWLKDSTFERREFKLLELPRSDVVFTKYDSGLPEDFAKITDATESTALREWLTKFE
jgi:hypothetical protein